MVDQAQDAAAKHEQRDAEVTDTHTTILTILIHCSDVLAYNIEINLRGTKKKLIFQHFLWNSYYLRSYQPYIWGGGGGVEHPLNTPLLSHIALQQSEININTFIKKIVLSRFEK